MKYIVLFMALLFHLSCFSAAGEQVKLYSQIDKERIYTPDDYIGVIEETFNKQNYFNPLLERDLLSIAESTINSNFKKKGANNSSAYKYELFCDRFAGYIALSNCGVMNENPNELVKEKELLFPPYLKAGLIYYFSTKPYNEEQRVELNNLLGDLKTKYAEQIQKIFPDFAKFAGSEKISRVVNDHVDEQLADIFENYFSFRTLHLCKEDVEKQISGDLEKINRKFPKYKNVFVERINDPNENPRIRESLKISYISAVKCNIESLMNEWIEDLYLLEKHDHKDYRDEILFRANRRYIGLSKDDIIRIQKSYTNHWNNFMTACKKLHDQNSAHVNNTSK